MIKVGIDAISFYTSQYYLDLETLATHRGQPADKYSKGLGQKKMSIPSPDEDIITLGANAAQKILQDENLENISTLLFATESGIDQSKAAGLYVHELLELPKSCRVLELKQACYSATGGIQLALGMIHQNPDQKIMIIAADIARYGLNTVGESSQGCGAVALLLSANPRLIEIESGSGVHTESVMDFWRPNYRDEALVDGKYSSKLYMSCLTSCWQQYQQRTARDFSSHDYFCYHTPVPKLVETAHRHLCKKQENIKASAEKITDALTYNQQAGNSYAASLYVSITSLLDNCQDDLTGKRIGLYSYGSGCVAEFFSGIVQPNYQKHCHAEEHQKQLASRQELSYEQYEEFYTFKLPQDGSSRQTPRFNTGTFRLSGISDHQRLYANTKQAPKQQNTETHYEDALTG